MRRGFVLMAVVLGALVLAASAQASSLVFIKGGNVWLANPDGVLGDNQIWDRISRGVYDFKDPAWGQVSKEAKDFVAQCLLMDPKKRPSSAELLRHPLHRRRAQKRNEPRYARFVEDSVDGREAAQRGGYATLGQRATLRRDACRASA